MTNRYGKYSLTVGAVESQNKSKNNLKNTLLTDLSQIKLKQLSVVFILNHINNLIDPAKIYLTLIVPKNIQSSYFNY